MMLFIRKQRKFVARIVMMLMAAFIFLPAAQAMAEQAYIPGFKTMPAAEPPRTALPVLKSITQGAAVDNAVERQLTIHQEQSKAILNWDSFNIGSDATVVFDQLGNTSWTALNRIYDSNPSLIYGTLKADGQVYLLNANGILFGSGSRINVHSLVGTSLDLSDENYKNGILRFTGDASRGDVINRGAISTDYNGSVFLIGPNVGNEGTISAPYGNISLAAITSGSLEIDSEDHMNWSDISVSDQYGLSGNAEGASLTADMGMVGMYGRIVNQEGLVRSVSALKKSGRIELAASELIHTGANSRTICPVDTSIDTADSSFGTDSVINLQGPNNSYTGAIWHEGKVQAPSGEVNLKAADRVLLDTDSVIDVSGIWQTKSAGANLLSAQLNSVELRDDTEQQDGILKGETVKFNAVTGTSIGDTSGTLTTQLITAMETSTGGGDINIDVSSSTGDVIVKEDSSLLFAGGGTYYSSGTFETTKLVSGNSIYDISDAGGGLTYDAILNSQSFTSIRYGSTKTYSGIYYGGVNRLNDYSSGYVEGDSAGSLKITTPRLVLDGLLDGSAVSGVYQTDTSELVNKSGNQSTAGNVESSGGTLSIGTAYISTSIENLSSIDAGINAISIVETATPLADDFTLNTALSDERASLCSISAETFNKAGLSKINLSANTLIGVETGAELKINNNAILNMQARQIDVNGDITIPSGTVALSLLENKTNLEAANQNLAQQITVAGTIDVSGRKVDNLTAAASSGSQEASNHLGGGSVALIDKTTQGKSLGVAIISSGHVDVSGGYAIGGGGKIKGGDAGSLIIQAENIGLDGTILGASPAGRKGGSLTLRTQKLYIGDNPGADIKWGLALGEHRLDATGFTQIGIEGVQAFQIEDGITLKPSYAKRLDPMPNANTGIVANYVSTLAGSSEELSREGLYLADQDSLGTSSITLLAGKGSLYERPYAQQIDDASLELVLPEHSAIEAGLEGRVSLEAPRLTIAGDITAHSGSITAKASAQDLTLTSNATLNARGYNQLDQTAPVEGLTAGSTPLNGGSITISGANGDLVVEKGALIDVSGAEVTELATINADRTLTITPNASSAGSLKLSYLGTLDLSGTLRGQSYLNGYTGGSLSISKSDITQGLDVTTGMLAGHLSGGFDSLTLTSPAAITFMDTGYGVLDAGRSLTLNAPVIAGAGSSGQTISLSASQITMTGAYYTAGQTVKDGDSTLELNASWIDLSGNLLLEGFGTARLTALHDMTLTGMKCANTGTSSSKYVGLLSAPGDLRLTAARIYPTTQSSFTIESGKTLATRSSGLSATHDGAILSAGGSVTLLAQTIDHGSALYAPMGDITLESSEQTTLKNGSVLFVAGQAGVAYGTLSETTWSVTDPADDTTTAVEKAPSKSITVTSKGDTVINNGAVIDASGGGWVFGYNFVSGTEGSTSPLIGKYILVPGLIRGGTALKLDAGAGLVAGTYSIVYIKDADDADASLAFLSGALVLDDLGTANAAGLSTQSSEGYDLVSGYLTNAGLSQSSTVKHVFSVQSASDLLAGYDVKEVTAGDGGAISISGQSAIVAAAVKSTALSGHGSGSLSLSALKTEVVSGNIAAQDIIDAEGGINTEYENTCIVSSDALRDSRIGEINIGESGKTRTVTVEEGAEVTGTNLAFNADEEIDILNSSSITATGTIKLVSSEGAIDVDENATVHAGIGLTLDAMVINNEGNFSSDDGSLILAADHVYVASEGTAGTHTDGLNLSVAANGSLNGFTGFDTVTLHGKEDLAFVGDVDLATDKGLVLDTPRLASENAQTSVGNVSLSSSTVSFLNSRDTSAGDTSLNDAATLAVSSDNMSIGGGSILLDGFGDVNISATHDLTFTGQGSLSIDGGENHTLNLTAGQIKAFGTRRATGAYDTDLGYYETARFALGAGERSLNILSSGIEAKSLSVSEIPGGSLNLRARTILNAGNINIPSGTLTMNAADSITVASGAKISVQGTDSTAAGNVGLTSGIGNVDVKSGSTVDISAGTQGDAGSLSVSAVNGSISFDGTLNAAGSGASLAADASDADLEVLAAKAAEGAVNGTFSVRSRTGDLNLTGGKSITAQDIELTADSGSITIAGTLNAEGEEGGYVSLDAGKDLTVSGSIDAAAAESEAKGGEVHLFAGSNDENGTLSFSGSIDLAGGDTGSGGSLYLRAPRTPDNNDVRMSLSGGAVTGAEHVVAQAFRVYDTDTISASTINTAGDIYTDTAAFASVSGTLRERLFGSEGLKLSEGDINVLAGIEIDSISDLTLGTNWDLSSWRFGSGSNPVMLTLKTGGDLILNGNIVDHPTAYTGLTAGQDLNSAGITLKAGQDINVGSRLVYTENGSVNFTAGRDLVVTSSSNPGYMINSDSNLTYNLATFDGDIRGRVGRDILLARYISATGATTGGAIQSAAGDIDLASGRNVVLGYNGTLKGAVRTTGWNSSISRYYNYASGGDIVIDAGGDITGGINVYAWDSGYGRNNKQYWGAAYATNTSKTTLPTFGIAAMGGGDVNVRIEGNFETQAGTFGNNDPGNLSISAGGDINGRFLVRRGACDLNTLGNFGVDLSGRLENETIEAFDTSVSLWAAGDVILGSVVNPTIDRPIFAQSVSDISGSMTLTYTENASVDITSLTGDVTLTGVAGPYEKRSDYSATTDNSNILPATLNISAGRDIVLGYERLYLTPSPAGNLSLTAERNITNMYVEHGETKSGKITMADCLPELVYGVELTPVTMGDYLTATSNTDLIHRSTDSSGTESGNGKAAIVTAGRDITNIQFYLPKPVAVTAGNDIKDIYIQAQNLISGDVTIIQAGDSIRLSSVDVDANENSGINCGGPGTLIVQAGGDLDLGNTQGIQSVANQFNEISNTGCDLIVAAGVEKTLDPQTVASLFAALKDAGVSYTSLKDSDPAAAAAIISDINDNLVTPLLGGEENSAGNILMTRSQIKTYGKDNDINILTAGLLNVGRSAIASSGSGAGDSSGITTDFGGAVNTLALGDVNVLESRMMTLYGGDILVWSVYGDINAGRGSKTQINRQQSVRYFDETTGTYKYKTQAVAVGSGIRTLTYDPDGVGPEAAPAAGDAYIFAPGGYIDAGEAGIGAENLFVGAEEVRNSQNIDVSGLSVGVPSATVNTTAISALSGTSALASSSSISESMSAVSSSSSAKKALENEQSYVPKWVKVMVLGFEENDTGTTGKEKEMKEQK